MRRFVHFLLLPALLFSVTGCKRRAAATAPATVSSVESRGETETGAEPRSPAVAADTDQVDIASELSAPSDLPRRSGATLSLPQPDLELLEPPTDADLLLEAPPAETDSPLGPEVDPSPMDELAEVEFYTLEVDAALQESVSAELRQLNFDIPVVLNQPVLQFLEYYQGRGRKIMEAGLQRSGRYLDYFRQVFEEENVPRDLTFLPHVESLFKPRAYSRAHARGLWQFVRDTGRKYGLEADWWLDERSNVRKSTVAAARHLRDLHEEFGDWYLVLAAYNSGAGRVRRIRQRHGAIDYWEMRRRRLLPRETRNYVPSFLASLIIFKHPEKYGFQVEPDPPVQFEEVRLDYQLDLRVAAELLGIKTEELWELNPQLRRGVTPYQHPDFALKVPVGKGEEFAAALQDLPEDQRLRVQHYRVRNGDTLSAIARRFGSSVRAIAEMNRIRNVHRLRLGQDLLIPSPGFRSPAGASKLGVGGRASTYVVRRGDSLYRIARRYGLTVAQLASWNNLRPSQTIFPGQRLRLTRGSKAAGFRQ